MNALREAIAAVRAQRGCLPNALPYPEWVIRLCDEAEKALARLATAEQIIAEKDKTLSIIRERANDAHGGGISHEGLRNAICLIDQTAASALSLRLDDK